MNQSPPGTIFLHSITPEQFYDQIRAIIKQEMQQDQLLTKEGALKMTGVSNAAFLKAIHEGVIHPQLVKGRSKAMYLESEVLKIQKRKKPARPDQPAP
jgi:predicted DNA-binding transcriptional regulator AlpA